MKIVSPAPSAINRASISFLKPAFIRSGRLIRNVSLAVLFGLSLLSVAAGRIYAQDGKGAACASPSPDTLTAQVSGWSNGKIREEKKGRSREVLKGTTHDLAMLDIRVFTLGVGQSALMAGPASPAGLPSAPAVPVAAQREEADILVIVKEGSLTLTIEERPDDTLNSRPHIISKALGPGGVALFAAGERPGFTNIGSAAVTYYVFRFRSRSPEDRDRALQGGPPFLIDWKEMVMKKTGKGESRPIFNRPVAWLGKIELHATTLNPGEVSHPPHVHRAEEIILLRSGTNVQEYIDGKYYKASAGDLIFLPSGVPHALENKGGGPCEYFALQWMP